MSDYKTVNGYDVKTNEHRNHRIPTHARRLCAALDRDNDAVERIDYGTRWVFVWMDADNECESFDVPDGWHVEKVGVYGGGVCVDLAPEGDR